jgi:threonine dehydrogenase-like Zn-dependent dehydrogenase
MKTLSAKLVKPRTFELINVEVPALKGNEVLLAVAACGICVSEVPVYEGRVIGTPGVSFRYKQYPADVGHEVVGRVIDKGRKVARFQVGDLATGLTYSGCGFAHHFVEDEASLVKIPESTGSDVRLAIGEPLMATANMLKQIQPHFGDSIAVIGDGFMALLLIGALATYPLDQLVVVGHHPARLAVARDLGATTVVNSHEEDPWQAIMGRTCSRGVDVSVDYAGNPGALRLAASVCKAKVRAKLVLAASYDNDMPFTIGNYLQNRAPILVPAYPNQSLNKLDDLERGVWGYARGIFPMGKLVTHRYSLRQVADGFEDCIHRRNGYIKGIVVPSEDT